MFKNLKLSITSLFILIFAHSISGQIVTLTPNFPSADDTAVTVVFDASQGTAGLAGASSVYLHSGIVIEGPNGTTWENVVGNWGQDDGIGKMSKVEGETDKWQITLTPDIRTYYNASETASIYRLSMVFRNADGSAEGKGSPGDFDGGSVASNGDIFLNLDAGDFVTINKPNENLFFLVNNDKVGIGATSSRNATSLTLSRLDELGNLQELSNTVNTDTINYTYTVSGTDSVTIIATAEIAGILYADTTSFSVFLRSGSPVASLPEGLKPGINYSEDETKATLVLNAPNKEFVYVVGDFNNWRIDDTYKMNITPDGETFWINLTELEPGKEYVFQYWVDGIIKIGDPYADKVADPWNDPFIPEIVYPNLPTYNRQEDGIATVLQTAQAPYNWTFPEVAGGKPVPEELVIYELLVRDFLGSHSYTDLTDSLDYLADLGVNAIELMPIMEYEGNLSWGYNPSYFFAPDKYYGSKNDLKAFIDKAHEKGIAVILDMVLNHAFGQNAMVRMYWDAQNNQPAVDNPWFNQQPTHPFNVGYDFNHESDYTKAFVDAVNAYWLTEYNFDGFRFDLSKGFTQQNNINDIGAWSAYDASRIALLKRMADKIWDVEDDAYIILEHFADNTEEQELAAYKNGMMLWGNLTHDYGDALKGNTSANFDWILSDSRNWENDRVVGYMESHDEERLMVKNLNEGKAEGAYNIKNEAIALERLKLGAAFFYTVPGPKMLWQFGEMGYDFSINACPPDWTTIQENCRVDNKPIPWGNFHDLDYYNDPLRAQLRKATAAIINLTREYSTAFEEGNFSWTPTGQLRKINIDHETLSVTIIGNFGTTEGEIDPSFTKTGKWYNFFNLDSIEVSDTNIPISLAPGEFHIYTDKAVFAPERNLVIPFEPIITVNPPAFSASEEITITFNAAIADAGDTQGLVGAEKVYMYAGVVLDGINSSNLTNFKGTTDQDDGIGLMTKVTGEENLWQITFTPNQYFEIADEQIFSIGLYFRDTNGTNIGKGLGNSTIFIAVEPDKNIVTTNPLVFNILDDVTIFFDAKLADPAGTSGLQGATKVYMHSGIVTENETSTSWGSVVGNWGIDDGIGLMTAAKGETDVWQITINPKAYYSVPDNTPIYKLGMVFRNADGSAEAKGPGGNDIFVPVSQEVTGLDREDISANFNIFPNPANQTVAFTLTGISERKLQLQLIDLTGTLISNKTFTNINGNFIYQQDFSFLPKGMYLVKVFTNKKQAIKKLLIQH
ncbi:MAG: alpha-amylase family glycosyl hydrolase [Bacteroidota bacterium]